MSQSALDSLTPQSRRLVLYLIIFGLLLFISSFVAVGWLAYSSNSGAISQAFVSGVETGPIVSVELEIAQSPLILGSLMALSAILVGSSVYVSRAFKGAERRPLWLGNWWLLMIPLSAADFLIDAFPTKLIFMVLMVLVGLGFWKGNLNSSLGFFMGPFMVAQDLQDGVFHAFREACTSPGYLSCYVRAFSDLYLTFLFVGLTYVTISSRAKRPSLALIVVTVILTAIVLIGVPVLL